MCNVFCPSLPWVDVGSCFLVFLHAVALPLLERETSVFSLHPGPTVVAVLSSLPLGRLQGEVRWSSSRSQLSTRTFTRRRDTSSSLWNDAREKMKGHIPQYNSTARVTKCFEIPILLSCTCVDFVEMHVVVECSIVLLLRHSGARDFGSQHTILVSGRGGPCQ